MSTEKIYSYKDKSDTSFQSGEILRDKHMYNSSIHCFYYSCIQIANHYFNKVEKLSDNEIRKKFSTPESHNQTINYLVKKFGLSTRKILVTDLSALKDSRKKADYRIFPVYKEESDDALEYATDIRDTIIKNIK